MILNLIAFVTLSFSWADSPSEPLRDVVESGDRTYFILTYQESAKWLTQVFRSIEDEPEDRILNKTFATAELAIQFHDQVVKSYLSTATPRFRKLKNQKAVQTTEETIWPVTQNWNWQWEMQYSEWIRKSVDKFFFIKYNLPTDCADVIIGLRWIFARMNGLPVVNSLSGSGRLVGHMTIKKEWRDLPSAANWYEDQRFLAALSYIFRTTYTDSLGKDSYPLKIDRQFLIPGAHHLEFHERGGHAMIVKELKFTGKTSVDIVMMDSTLPVEVRRLTQKNYMYGVQPEEGTGFQRLKWPFNFDGQWKFLASEDYPGYSTEQNEPLFMIGYGTFSSAVKASLTGNLQFDIKEWTNTLKELELKIKERAKVVQEGFDACQSLDCSPGSAGWQEHSTPNRDSRLQGLIVGVIKTIDLHKTDKKVLGPWDKLILKTFLINKTQSFTFKKAIENSYNGKLDADPRRSVEQRWGN